MFAHEGPLPTWDDIHHLNTNFLSHPGGGCCILLPQKHHITAWVDRANVADQQALASGEVPNPAAASPAIAIATATATTAEAPHGILVTANVASAEKVGL